jgi:hypothetical protein
LYDGVAADDILPMGDFVSPFLRPVLADKVRAVSPSVEVETRDCGFNVNFTGH